MERGFSVRELVCFVPFRELTVLFRPRATVLYAWHDATSLYPPRLHPSGKHWDHYGAALCRSGHAIRGRLVLSA